MGSPLVGLFFLALPSVSECALATTAVWRAAILHTEAKFAANYPSTRPFEITRALDAWKNGKGAVPYRPLKIVKLANGVQLARYVEGFNGTLVTPT